MYNEEYDAYVLTQDQYIQLTSAYTDGYEYLGYDEELGGYLVNIYTDAILEALGLGDYHGGTIIVVQTGQGGPM